MQSDNFSDTKVNLTLGGKVYLLNFGLATMRRIEEEKPGFSLLSDSMAAFEILPFLIRNAIPPVQRDWEAEGWKGGTFEDLFDECTDEENLPLVLLAYQNAMGFIDRQFVPVLGRIQADISKMQEAAEAATKGPKKE